MSSATVADLVEDPQVVSRVLNLWAPDVAVVWLQSPNAHLSGATPLDVLRVRGADEVLDALDATLAGAYA